MNNEVYKLRRQVISFIYEAKELVPDLPRIDVRITETDRHRTLGVAHMGNCTIWIPEHTLSRKSLEIRHVVFHELLHAAYAIEHVDGCPLMNPVVSDTTKAVQNRLFKKYAGVK